MKRRTVCTVGLATTMMVALALLLARSPNFTANAQQAATTEVKIDNFSFGPATPGVTPKTAQPREESTGGFAVTARFARLANASQADQDAQIIEVTAKKYDYTPSPIRVKPGVQVQLKITSLDKTHGFKINLYPDGSDAKGDPGLIFSSKEDCFKIEKGTSTVVQFVARTPGTYSFHCCNRCGIGHGGMKGQLIVEP